jgi:general stress protein 26
MKPEPIPVPDDLRGVALATMKAAPFPMLASIDGAQPRVRPVSPVRTDGFVVYVASLRSSHKTAELEANGRVELCYMAEGHDQVRITGLCERVIDRAVLQEVWDSNPLLRAFLRTIDNPEFILYKINPDKVRFMREWALDYYDVPL